MNKEEQYDGLILVDKELARINQSICDAVRPVLRNKKAWIFLRQDHKPYYSEDRIPTPAEDDVAAILYDAGDCRGATDLTRPLWRTACEVLWDVATKMAEDELEEVTL